MSSKKDEYEVIDWGFEVAPEPDPAVDEATAEKDFYRFMKKNSLKMKYRKGDERFGSFCENREAVLEGIMDGSITIDDKGCPTYTPKDSPGFGPVVFSKPKGDHRAAMSKERMDLPLLGIYEMMAVITQRPASDFSRMAESDVGVLLAIENLFLG